MSSFSLFPRGALEEEGHQSKPYLSARGPALCTTRESALGRKPLLGVCIISWTRWLPWAEGISLQKGATMSHEEPTLMAAGGHMYQPAKEIEGDTNKISYSLCTAQNLWLFHTKFTPSRHSFYRIFIGHKSKLVGPPWTAACSWF